MKLGQTLPPKSLSLACQNKANRTLKFVPERRYYDVRTMTMSEVGLDAGFWGDLYIVMGDNLGKGEFTFPFTLQTAYSLVMAHSRGFNGTWCIMFSHQIWRENAMNKKIYFVFTTDFIIERLLTAFCWFT